jgi:hypothetical protein
MNGSMWHAGCVIILPEKDGFGRFPLFRWVIWMVSFNVCLAFAWHRSLDLVKELCMHHVRPWYTLSLPNAAQTADALTRRPIGQIDDTDCCRCSGARSQARRILLGALRSIKYLGPRSKRL